MDSDRYVSLNELPYIQQLARSIYLNNLNTPYQNDNSVLNFISENREIAKQKDKDNLIRPDIYLLNMLRKKFQPGAEPIPYGNINLDTRNLPSYIYGVGGRLSDLGFSG